MQRTPEQLKAHLIMAAHELGFADCRISPAHPAIHGQAFREWLEAGKHADMAWLEKNPERRIDPHLVLPEVRSVISLGHNYFPGQQPPAPRSSGAAGRIARYAWNDDYHDLIEEKLRDLDETLQSWGGIQRCYVDTGPVLERDVATAAGLGWNGKSCVQIHPKWGPWLFLSEILTSLPLPPDQAMSDHCGKCTRCLVACPTQAITAPHQLDARRCLSYLTIENPGPIPLEFRRALGDRIYGCDECLEVCPWNRFAKSSSELAFLARKELFDLSLRQHLQLNDQDFSRIFKKSPIKRIKRERWLRNVCVALGNVGELEDLDALQLCRDQESDLVREHAVWAIGEILSRHSPPTANHSASVKGQESHPG